MKPLATLNRPVLQTVDVVTKESTVSFRERTDVTAVPAMGVVAESMTALVLATEALRKFGGDSLAEVVRNRDGFVAVARHDAVVRRRHAAGRRRLRTAQPDDPPHPARRDDGRRQDHDGQLLAERLGWGYRDSDADVEAATGLTVPELFARDGEAAFRRAEADVLADACADPAPSVVSVAGGAVLSEDNRRLIAASGIVVWLRARPETLAARVGDGAGRPLLGDDPAEAWSASTPCARPLYAEVADVVLDVDDLDPATVVDRIVDAMGTRPPPRPPTGPGSAGERPPCTPSPSTWPSAPTRCSSARGPPRGGRFLPPTAKSAVIVTQESIQDAGWVDGLDPGVPFQVCLIPDGEDGQDAGHGRGARPLLRPGRALAGRRRRRRRGRHRHRRRPDSPPPPTTGAPPT